MRVLIGGCCEEHARTLAALIAVETVLVYSLSAALRSLKDGRCVLALLSRGFDGLGDVAPAVRDLSGLVRVVPVLYGDGEAEAARLVQLGAYACLDGDRPRFATQLREMISVVRWATTDLRAEVRARRAVRLPVAAPEVRQRRVLH